jgi:hypothetical protein
VVGELVGVPAEPAAEQHPPAGEVIERRDGLGQRDGVVLHRQRDRGAQLDPLGHRGGTGQRDPRIEGAHVPVVRK